MKKENWILVCAIKIKSTVKKHMDKFFLGLILVGIIACFLSLTVFTRSRTKEVEINPIDEGGYVVGKLKDPDKISFNFNSVDSNLSGIKLIYGASIESVFDISVNFYDVNDNKIIYKDIIKLAGNTEQDYLIINVPKQKESRNNEYKVELSSDNMGDEDYWTLYGNENNETGTITKINENTVNKQLISFSLHEVKRYPALWDSVFLLVLSISLYFIVIYSKKKKR